MIIIVNIKVYNINQVIDINKSYSESGKPI